MQCSPGRRPEYLFTQIFFWGRSLKIASASRVRTHAHDPYLQICIMSQDRTTNRPTTVHCTVTKPFFSWGRTPNPPCSILQYYNHKQKILNPGTQIRDAKTLLGTQSQVTQCVPRTHFTMCLWRTLQYAHIYQY